MSELDAYVAREVLEPFDHTYLNKDVAAFPRCRADDGKPVHRNFSDAQEISQARGWRAFAWKKQAATALNMRESPGERSMSEKTKATDAVGVAEEMKPVSDSDRASAHTIEHGKGRASERANERATTC